MAKSVAILGLFALLVVIIVGIALTVYFNTKKSGEETSDKPQLTFDANAKKTINPQDGEDNGTQEGYAIEYAEGDDSSKFIDLTLSWTNGSGFDSVSKLIFTRYVGDTKIQADQEVTEKSALADYGTGSVTFKGVDVTAGVDVKGTNIIKAYYNEVKPDNLLATAELDISDDDFSYTLAGPFGEYDVKVSISSETFKLTKSVKKIYYNLSYIPDRWFKLKINDDETYTFKYLNGTNPEGATDKLTMDGIDKFKMKSYKGRQILIHPNDDKKILVKGPLGHTPPQFLSESEMTRQDWGRASFTLTAASTITPGNKDYEYLKQGYNASRSYKSPNGNYRLEFQDDGNLVLRDKEDTVIWESKTHGNDNTAKTIVVRGRYNNETNGELVFSKANDLAGGNIILGFGSVGNNYEKPYTLILGDDGILTIIDKTGRFTEALDFIRTKGNIKPGDAIKCGDSPKIYRYIGHNQKNHYVNGEVASSMHGKHWGNEFKSLNGKWCKNTRTGPPINGSVVDDFPKLTYDDKINLGIGNLCTGSQDKINIMKEKCNNHATCGGIGQQTNGCWHQFSGKGHRWPKSHGYQKTLNFGRGATSGSHLFRMQ